MLTTIINLESKGPITYFKGDNLRMKTEITTLRDYNFKSTEYSPIAVQVGVSVNTIGT